MITVQRTVTFDMPTCCNKCPMLKSERDTNYTIEYCALLRSPNWVDNMVSVNRDARDPKCPLRDGKTYKL